MFKNKIIRYSTLVMFLAIVAYFLLETFQKPAEVQGLVTMEEIPEEQYAAGLAQQRKQKDQLFRTSEESPIEDVKLFSGLEYYEPDQDYRVLAKLTPYDGPDKELKLPYTDGTTATYERMAYADFTVKGVPQRLLLLKNEGTISILFRDATSGLESYGGGRYIDLPAEKVQGNSLIIDFNEAYNPYCAYAPDYACPLPPPENTMTAAIEAGEKFDAEKH
ncbi:DUF1684 domain-containing protein [Persicitalea jodogahamensis]|uniref:DUF1684 domain-containing protein n=1 Tax=Persicitalea jodogahamensis TaxID=402147 RepID=A0A8J3D256_9BACT|nr:DUF1684 domain-containing protein [Persicitalea jodogahamensis]GHB58707.1 hypothetical protein GCM10007390_10270 [Persicitalea jodogahamensis]